MNVTANPWEATEDKEYLFILGFDLGSMSWIFLIIGVSLLKFWN